MTPVSFTTIIIVVVVTVEVMVVLVGVPTFRFGRITRGGTRVTNKSN